MKQPESMNNYKKYLSVQTLKQVKDACYSLVTVLDLIDVIACRVEGVWVEDVRELYLLQT